MKELLRFIAICTVFVVTACSRKIIVVHIYEHPIKYDTSAEIIDPLRNILWYDQGLLDSISYLDDKGELKTKLLRSYDN